MLHLPIVLFRKEKSRRISCVWKYIKQTIIIITIIHCSCGFLLIMAISWTKDGEVMRGQLAQTPKSLAQREELFFSRMLSDMKPSGEIFVSCLSAIRSRQNLCLPKTPLNKKIKSM